MTRDDDIDQSPSAVKETGADARRRRAAKLLNERLKLMATFFNGIGIATLVAMIIVPLVNAEAGG